MGTNRSKFSTPTKYDLEIAQTFLNLILLRNKGCLKEERIPFSLSENRIEQLGTYGNLFLSLNDVKSVTISQMRVSNYGGYIFPPILIENKDGKRYLKNRISDIKKAEKGEEVNFSRTIEVKTLPEYEGKTVWVVNIERSGFKYREHAYVIYDESATVILPSFFAAMFCPEWKVNSIDSLMHDLKPRKQSGPFGFRMQLAGGPIYLT